MHQLPARHRVLMIAALLIAGGLPAAAQQPTSPQSTTALPPLRAPQSGAAESATAPTAQSAAEQRITALQTELHITPAQMPQWNAFTQAMRDNAASTDALFRQRAASAATMTALDNMKSYAEVARAYADHTETLANAFAGLYGVLSDQQKQTIDTMFRQQSAQNTGMRPASQ
jgi:periplasmic protein CpxP/Spy